jgi:glycosyltransferase involved in cell wall biosynthesis
MALSVAYLFISGRKHRLAANEPFPREMFYAAPQLAERGHHVTILEDADFPAVARTAAIRSVVRLATRLVRIDADTALRMAAGRSLLAGHDAIVCVAPYQGYALGALASLGLIRGRIVLMAMGLQPLPDRLSLARRLAIGGITLACISRAETNYLRATLGHHQDIAYIPFGVDSDYWTPQGQPGDYALAIGNDPSRDWEFLVSAWKPSYPPLRIVTNRPLPPLPPNVIRIAGDWRSEVLADWEVRELYRGARFVVVPMRQTIQPAGQSVTLQAMACARPVLISDIIGLWDRDLLRRDTCLLHGVGDSAELQRNIEYLLDDPGAGESIGQAARAAVVTRASVGVTADAMENLLTARCRS